MLGQGDWTRDSYSAKYICVDSAAESVPSPQSSGTDTRPTATLYPKTRTEARNYPFHRNFLRLPG